ncbi:hypothetical protein BGY98DRAFT_1101095 [Russula aff. rugulosa BPL654]|nr:hypothetical protein BGY98DRAFT_1101095 [Russula aff. rugulosa BPL654]
MEPLSSSNQMTTCEIGATFHGPDITPPTNPVHSSSRPTGVSLTVVVAAAAQDVTSTATLSHILEGSEQQDSDIAAFVNRNACTITNSNTLSNAPSEFHDTGVTSVSNTSHLAPSSIGSSVPASRPTACKLPSKAQRGAGLPETGGGVTPLLDSQQQDAEEFLSLYLDALDEELPPLLPSISSSQSASAVLEVEEHEASQSGQTEVGSLVGQLVESPITHIFWGKFPSHVRTSNKPDVTTEDWRSLHLDIQDSVHSRLDTHRHIPQPQSGEQVSTSGLGNASQQVLIEALPPVLFSITVTVSNTMWPQEEDRKVDPVGPRTRNHTRATLLQAYGVLYHHSESAGSGHYTVDVDVLHSNRDGDTGEVWLHVNDDAVTWLRHEDVFGAWY